jgi:hypothetical protein
MNTLPRPASHTTRFVLTLLAAIVSTAALAAPRAGSLDPRVRYQRESAACAAVRAPDDHANCLSEASTRFAGTQPPVPGESADILARNAVRRCEALRDQDRQDCIARMQGQGSTSGSVDSGGIYRELVTTVVGEPAEAQPPAPAAAQPAAK